jgi:hypothetical protein
MGSFVRLGSLRFGDVRPEADDRIRARVEQIQGAPEVWLSSGMRAARIPRVLGAGILGALLLGLSAMPAWASTGEVPRSVVQTQAARALAAATGQNLPKVTCPTGLKGKVGASINCIVIPSGSTTKYPVRVTVNSVRNGVAHFHVQVGQAIQAGDRTTFCRDNATLDKATLGATKPSDLIAIFKANKSTIDEFQATAPPAIVKDAGTLAQAAATAIRSGNASAFTTKAVARAARTTDAYCHQNADGTPATTSGG